MTPRKQSGSVPAGRGQKVNVRRKPTTRHNGPQARADERHAAVCRLLAIVKDPVITIGLGEAQAVASPVLVAACRSTALIVVLRRPELLREPELRAAEVARLMSAFLEVVDHGAE